MMFIADILLAAGALGAAFYCFVLGRRLRKFNNLENGMGGAVAVLSAQVDDLDKTLAATRATAEKSRTELLALTARAEDVRRQLELQIAALHDVAPQDGARAPIDANEPARGPSAPDPAQPAAEPARGPLFMRHRRDRVTS